MTYSLTLPVPPAECSPNWTGHLHVRANAVRAYRRQVALIARDHLNRGALPAFARPVRLHLDFHFRPGHGFRDADNARAAFKSGQDGLVDAGVLRGDSAEWVVLGETNISRERVCPGRPALGSLTVRFEEVGS